jgi:hypothetical protein
MTTTPGLGRAGATMYYPELYRDAARQAVAELRNERHAMRRARQTTNMSILHAALEDADRARSWSGYFQHQLLHPVASRSSY